MVEPIFWVVLAFFVIVTILDIKFKAVPSVIMTGMLLVVAIMNYENVAFGVLAYIFARLLYEFDKERGIADTKATVLIGFLMPTIESFIIYMMVLIVAQTCYTLVIRYFFPKVKEFPFLPAYLITYISLLMGGMF